MRQLSIEWTAYDYKKEMEQKGRKAVRELCKLSSAIMSPSTLKGQAGLAADHISWSLWPLNKGSKQEQ